MTEPAQLYIAWFLKLVKGALSTGLFKVVRKRGRRVGPLKSLLLSNFWLMANHRPWREGASTRWGRKVSEAQAGIPGMEAKHIVRAFALNPHQF